MNPHDVAAAGVRPVATVADIGAASAEVKSVACGPEVQGYIVSIVRATRDAPSVSLGVSPRGATALLHASKAWAWLGDRPFVTPDDVKAMAKACFRHRLQLRPEVELEGGNPDGILDGILATVPVPR
ncbi:MAG: AAA family ATPase, partial [Acidimicrobiales bacterium]